MKFEVDKRDNDIVLLFAKAIARESREESMVDMFPTYVIIPIPYLRGRYGMYIHGLLNAVALRSRVTDAISLSIVNK